jgi:hypothetical protein
MSTGATFRFEGMYRIQSHRLCERSALAGHWIPEDPFLIDSDAVNAALEQSELWNGQHVANVRSVIVEQRSGAFSEPDALYYRDAFIPDSHSEPLLSDVIDVSKLQDHWERRKKYVAALFEEQFESLTVALGEPSIAASNEYHCHEGGHLLGWDIRSKHASSYFRVGGKTLWPLIHTEEHRADMHSLALALEILPFDRAISVFVYHLLHRFGLAMESVASNGPDAGPVPYFLFCTLLNLGALSVSSGGFRLTSVEPDSLARIMNQCGDQAFKGLTAVEMDSKLPIDIGLNAAGYYRSMAADIRSFEMFTTALNSSINRCIERSA